jgi:hypothetical protein
MIPNFVVESLLNLHMLIDTPQHSWLDGWLGDPTKYVFYVALVFTCLERTL